MQKVIRKTYFGATSLSGVVMFIGAQLDTRVARAATTGNSIRLEAGGLHPMDKMDLATRGVILKGAMRS